jgi:hypothetical protein
MNNIEKIVYDYLNAEGLTAYMEFPESDPVPAEVPVNFVVIQKTGSGWRDRLLEATLAIQSYAPTQYEASELNLSLIETMLGIVTRDEVAKITLNSDYEFTDTERKRPRYQAVFDIVYYQ